MRGNKVGDEVLLFTRFAGEPLKHLGKAVIAPHPRLHHLGKGTRFSVFRRNLQVATYMMSHQLPHIFWALHRQVVSKSRGDQYLFDAFGFPGFAIQIDQRGVVSIQIFADAGVYAAELSAGRFGFLVLAGDAPHIGGRAAEVRDHAGEGGAGIANAFHLA